jgi:hypothetical protein
MNDYVRLVEQESSYQEMPGDGLRDLEEDEDDVFIDGAAAGGECTRVFDGVWACERVVGESARLSLCQN